MIAAGTTIRGQVSGDEDLVVEGRIEGSVRLSKNLTITGSGVLLAQIEAKAVGVAGQITGNIIATEALALEAGALVVGDITTPRLIIEDGARFKGRVTMNVDIPPLAAAPPPPIPSGAERAISSAILKTSLCANSGAHPHGEYCHRQHPHD
ncbi:MAG: polymer-forming cytoskeletal protein [Myxococcales bacterium]|nr:polymer-forming cytoskeletal protein [Myxococcales bacterium]